MLSRVVELIENENFTINNIDITLLVEKPKIAPYREQIVRSLQTILKLDLNRISLKAKTNEKMGFVGREEGVVAYAVVTLIKNERRENKPHIGVFGRKNNGKSSLINAITQQEIAIVSPCPARQPTRKKSIEIFGIGRNSH